MTKDKLIEKFQDAGQRHKLRVNYENILGRFHESGFFPESLTGSYAGMFPRTVGALAQLLTLTGELEQLEKSVDYCRQAMLDHDLESVPHVVGLAEQHAPIPIVDDTCQIDGQAHLILAWALLALAREQSPYEDSTYLYFAQLMDRSISGGFLGNGAHWRCEPGLILNTHLEHSREWNFWIAYDFLSNSFVASALEKMIQVAQRRGDEPNSQKWQTRLDRLTEAINGNMTFEREGKVCYCEMLLPSGRTPVPFPGLSWLNLAPIPSGWEGFDHDLLENTIGLWHERAAIEWDGPFITACELNFEGAQEPKPHWNGPDDMYCEWSPKGHNNQTYGKMLGWDLLYCVKFGHYSHAHKILAFLDTVDSDLYPEIFTYRPSRHQWMLRDAGNGEQASWLCWSIMESRRLLGLAPL